MLNYRRVVRRGEVTVECENMAKNTRDEGELQDIICKVKVRRRR